MKSQTGDDLIEFANGRLSPYLHGLKRKTTGPNTIEYKIGEIFGELKNRIQSGYNLREIIDHIDDLRFRSQTEEPELSHLYEAKIKNMGNAGRNGGEYYTPRPLIRAIVTVVNPRIGETIYDGALGSAGFHCEAFDYLKRTNPKRTTAQDRLLQERTFYGKEKKSLAYVIAIMNMILHGIEAPNIVHTNTWRRTLQMCRKRIVTTSSSPLRPSAVRNGPSARLAGVDAGASESPDRFAGNCANADNNAKLFRLLTEVPWEKRAARLRCMLALTPVLLVAQTGSSTVCHADELVL